MNDVKISLDASKSKIAMSEVELDTALLHIHDLLRARNAPKPGSFTALDAVGRREYYRVARRRSRANQSAADRAGDFQPTVANIRSALADAALMILATDAPGAARKHLCRQGGRTPIGSRPREVGKAAP